MRGEDTVFDRENLFSDEEWGRLKPWFDLRMEMAKFRRDRLKRYKELDATISIEFFERQVKSREERVEHFEELGAPESIMLSENWVLQEAKADLAYLKKCQREEQAS